MGVLQGSEPPNQPGAGPGRTGRGGDRAGGWQVAPGKRHARRASRAGGWEKFLPNFPTPGRRGRGAAATPGASGRRGLELPGPGSTASARGAPPGPYLPSSRARMSRCGCNSGSGEGAVGGGEARGALSVLHLRVQSARRQRRRHGGPRTRYLKRREFPGSPPLGLTLHLLPARRPPRSRLRPGGGGGGGGGSGAGATCARARAAHRNSRRARPGSSAPRLPAPAHARGLRTVLPRAGSVASLSYAARLNMAAGGRGGFPRRRWPRGREEEALLHAESRAPAPLPCCRHCGRSCGGRWSVGRSSRPSALSFPLPLSAVPRASVRCAGGQG